MNKFTQTLCHDGPSICDVHHEFPRPCLPVFSRKHDCLDAGELVEENVFASVWMALPSFRFCQRPELHIVRESKILWIAAI